MISSPRLEEEAAAQEGVLAQAKSFENLEMNSYLQQPSDDHRVLQLGIDQKLELQENLTRNSKDFSEIPDFELKWKET